MNTTGSKTEKKQNGNFRFYLVYTVLFLAAACFLYGAILRRGESLVYKDDSLKQHLRALIYYGKYLRTVFRTIFVEHSLNIPEYSFSIGFGSDILTTLNYYAIGDPLNLLSAVIPVRYIHHYYGFLIVLRAWLMGFAFSRYCFYMGKYDRNGVLAGSLCYSFCEFALYGALKHPFFGNPMIYLPLLLLGAEKILREKKPWFFIGMVMLSAISNFYFLYMLVLMVVFYVIVRECMRWRKGSARTAATEIILFAVYGLIGILLSAVVLLPVFLATMDTQRSGADQMIGLFYPLYYYRLFFAEFCVGATPGFWVRLGFPALAFLAVLLLLTDRKKDVALRRVFLVVTLFLLLPAAGFVLNGFVYVANRWIFGYAFVVSLVLTVKWKDFFEAPVQKIGLLFVLVTLYYIISEACLGEESVLLRRLFFAILCAVCSLAVLFACRFAGAKYRKILTGCLILGFVGNLAILSHYASVISGRLSEGFERNDEIYFNMNETDGAAVKSVGDENGEPYRYSGDVYNVYNANSMLTTGLMNAQSYWSLGGSFLPQVVEELGMNQRFSFNFKNMEHRSILNALAGVKYYVIRDLEGKKNGLPYGFDQLVETERQVRNFQVYQNRYALPLGYGYRNLISRESYEKLDEIQKEEAMLQAAVVDEIPEGFSEYTPELSDRDIEYTIQNDSKYISVKEDGFIVTKNGVSLRLAFEGLPESETFVLFHGLDVTETRLIDLYNDDESIDPDHLFTAEKWEKLSAAKKKSTKKKAVEWVPYDELDIRITSGNTENEHLEFKLNYITPYHSYYWNRHDFALSLGYSGKPLTYVDIKFPQKGRYMFDDLRIVCRPVETYAGYMTALQDQGMTGISLHNDNSAYATNEMTGEVTMHQDGLLCMSVPYSRGWTAYVDGEKTGIVRTNTTYTGIYVKEGTHQIRLLYNTPGKKEGFLVTLAGLLCLCALWMVRRKYPGN